MVSPSEVLPNYIESVWICHLPYQKKNGCYKHRNTDKQTTMHRMLFDTQKLGNDESGTAKGSIATGNRSCHYTEKGKNSTSYSKPTGTDHLHDCRSIKELNERLTSRSTKLSDKLLGDISRNNLFPTSIIEEVDRNGSPYQSDYTLSNHRTVEDRTTQFLTFHTTCHQRTLSSMETTDGSTGYRDEKTRENRILVHKGIHT